MVVNLIRNYCFTRVLLYAKMLKETEAKETISCFHIFVISGISIGQGAGHLPPSSVATSMIYGVSNLSTTY